MTLLILGIVTGLCFLVLLACVVVLIFSDEIDRKQLAFIVGMAFLVLSLISAANLVEAAKRHDTSVRSPL